MLKNLVFFGSAQFTAEIFESLLEAKIVNIVAVVTTPDRPVGRKQIITPSPLAIAAEKYNLPIYKPESLDEANLAHLRLLKPDIFLVVAYGQYFNQEWLKAPTLKTLNIHFSLLPKYRGSLCISEALKNGDSETGVTLMEMGEKLDAGPIIAQQKVEIDIDDNNQSLNSKLTEKAKNLLLHDFVLYLDEGISSEAQNEQLATYTPSFKTKTRQNAFVEWQRIQDSIDNKLTNSEKLALHNFIRSNNPNPGAWTIYNGLEMKIIKTSIKPNNDFSLKTIQFSGKNPAPWK